jgi:glycosyltransferase involved in cell wall biosynthesis
MTAPHILHIFSTFAPAGPELRCVSLIHAAGASYRHTILAIDGRTSAAEELASDAPVTLLDAPPKAGTLRTTRRLRAILRTQAPDLVCTYNWGALDGVMAAVACKIPILHHEDGFNADEVQRLKRRRTYLRRALLPLTHRVIVPSKRLEKIATETWRLKPHKLERIPNGIDADHFAVRAEPNSVRSEFAIPASACLIGFMGHLRPVKNAARLLEAAAPIAAEHDLHLLLLGDGEERADLERRAAQSDLAGRVHFAGHIADPRAHLQAMDLFALSSDSEQHPIALLEAMACGLPVAATRVGDVEHILGEAQHPFISPLETGAGGLRSVLRELQADPELRLRLGAKNLSRVRAELSAQKMIERHLDLWRSGVEATA